MPWDIGKPAEEVTCSNHFWYILIRVFVLVLLLGGGFALAEGFKSSGLLQWLGDELAQLQMLPVALLLFLFITLVIWLTEVMSNMSVASIMIPISASLAVAIEVNPLTFMIVSLVYLCVFQHPFVDMN